MSDKRYLLDQPADEVRAAMREEGCERCFGCPFANMTTAAIVHRTTSLMEFAYETNGFEHPYIQETERDVEEYRKKLFDMTKKCIGYSEKKRPFGRPAGMCDSPEVKYPKISLWAGRLLEKIENK